MTRRFVELGALAGAIVASAATPALAQQDDVFVQPQAPVAIAPDALAQARAAAARGDPAEALSRYLRVLAETPDNVAALAGAGRAALDVGDVNAAAGFFARADALDPRRGEVKAGLAATMLRNGNARAALRMFREATDLGVPPATVAADRGLAWDLRGDTRRAQLEYQLALKAQPSDEIVRRLALSQAIAGDRVAAMATLDPLLRRQDVPAWRARAFVFALTGDVFDAMAGAALVMPRDQVDALAPYVNRLAALRPADKAAAIHLGRFPGEGEPPTRTAAVASTTRPAPPPKIAIDRATLLPTAEPPRYSAALAQTSRAPTPAPVVPAPVPAPVIASPPPPIVIASVDPGRTTGEAPALSAARAAPPPILAPAPAPVAATAPDPARLKAEAAARARADAKAKAAAKAKADAAARAKEAREEEAAERAAAKKNPARHWVQVAGGANAEALPRAWAALKKKWPSQLAGRSPWSTHYRFTNRLMIGPFPTTDAAQDWVSARNKEGFATFRVETNAGDPVERVGGD